MSSSLHFAAENFTVASAIAEVEGQCEEKKGRNSAMVNSCDGFRGCVDGLGHTGTATAASSPDQGHDAGPAQRGGGPGAVAALAHRERQAGTATQPAAGD